MVLALVIFFFSILAIIGLFAVKRWETTSGRIVAPTFRTKADTRAEQLRDLLFALESDIEKLPSEILRLARMLVHEIALAAARGARFFEGQSHRVADMVSHKHRFERRAPRSEFLNKIAEHKNGNGEGKPEDTTSFELDLRDK